MEVNNIVKTSVYIEQIEKVLGNAFEEEVKLMLERGTILEKKKHK
ncbi:hypothetical protein RCO48_02535 [Peribacillus frigoritolerans]|nr:hypothetical protein [Peribacillus frigoritolerans]